MGICLGTQFQGPFSCGLNGQVCTQCASGNVCANGACTAPFPDAGITDGGIVSVDAGFPVGSSCLSDPQCAPASTGLCIPQSVVGTQTGWPGGYCTSSCATVACAAGASCINAANANGTANWLCLRSCTGPRAGQSSCRSSYVCEFDLGNPSGQGVCIPRCNSPGFSCWAGTTCNAATGYCMNTGPVPP